MKPNDHENSLQTATRWTGNVLWAGYWAWLIGRLFRTTERPKVTRLGNLAFTTEENNRLIDQAQSRLSSLKAWIEPVFGNPVTYCLREPEKGAAWAEKADEITKWTALFCTVDGQYWVKEMHEIVKSLHALEMPSIAQIAQRNEMLQWFAAIDAEYREYCIQDLVVQNRNARLHREQLRQYRLANGYPIGDIDRSVDETLNPLTNRIFQRRELEFDGFAGPLFQDEVVSTTWGGVRPGFIFAILAIGIVLNLLVMIFE